MFISRSAQEYIIISLFWNCFAQKVLNQNTESTHVTTLHALSKLFVNMSTTPLHPLPEKQWNLLIFYVLDKLKTYQNTSKIQKKILQIS